jgi:hypothetical protein
VKEILAMIIGGRKHEPYTESPNSLGPINARQLNGMIISFPDMKGTVHNEFVLAGQTLHSAYYCDFYGNCVKIREDFAPNFGDRRTGCCIMAVHHLTIPPSPGNLWPKST